MTTTISDTYTTTAPELVGVWVHPMADSADGERHFPFQSGDRSESLSVESTALKFEGRTFPVVEFGGGQTEDIAARIFIPFGDTHDADVQWLRDELRAKRLMCYRDNRGRVVFGNIWGSLGIGDAQTGTNTTLQVKRVDYTEAPV